MIWRVFAFGGASRIRTDDQGFANPCLTAWLWRRHRAYPEYRKSIPLRTAHVYRESRPISGFSTVANLLIMRQSHVHIRKFNSTAADDIEISLPPLILINLTILNLTPLRHTAIFKSVNHASNPKGDNIHVR